MWRWGTRDRWYWLTDVNVGVNFCVWTLRADGLRAPPFDRHPDGDGTLREAGLTRTSWRSWLERVLDLQRQFHETSRRGVWPPPRELALLSSETYRPWEDAPAVGAALAELWPRYYAQAEVWRRRHTLETDPARPPSAAEGRRLWRAVTRAHGDLPSLRVYLVDYPDVVLALVPPLSALLGTGAGTLPWPTYASSVVQATRLLARR